MTRAVAPHVHGAAAPDGFRHEALFYAGESEFLEQTLTFIREGLEAFEVLLVVVNEEKIRALRGELAGDAAEVHFTDMTEVGVNPARIIPAWQEFVDEHGPQRRLRGIGEPIWPGRSADEIVECHRHEELLNVAFAGSAPWWLLCPYDVDALDPAVIEEATRTHPFLRRDGEHHANPACSDIEELALPFAAPLPAPPVNTRELDFTEADLAALRRFVATEAAFAGVEPARRDALVLAVHEAAANSICHGGGFGTLRVWSEPDALLCEISDAGQISDPLIGRERPTVDQLRGRGLWLVNHLCDLVQLRVFPTGTVVRMHIRLQ